MAHIEGGKGGKRNGNFELNLVPVIDLMSVLITFLLITAVWTQVSMIQIGSSIYGKKSDTTPSVPPPLSDVVVKVDVKATGYVLTISKQVISMPLVDGKFDDAGLIAQLQRVKQLYPEKQDAVIAIADEIPYEALITTMDDVLIAGFPSISIATGGPN
jgi:biopolymer transport protein ExbD